MKPLRKGDIMTIIAVPKILRDKLTDEGTEALVRIMNQVEERSQLAVLELADERCEKRLAHLDAKIDKSAAELDAKIVKLDAKIDTSVAALDARIETSAEKLNARIEKVRADVIQWMFIFWVGQVGSMAAILFGFFKR